MEFRESKSSKKRVALLNVAHVLITTKYYMYLVLSSFKKVKWEFV